MLKFLKDFLCVIICFVCYEFNLYNKDYNQVLTMSKYVIYDLKNSDIKSFYNEKFNVTITNNGGVIEYKIIMKRESLFSIKSLKTIEYRGLVE